MTNNKRLIEVAKLFFKLGCIGFGGPASHIAMMEDEVVSKRKWISHEHFIDLIGATNLIPGPNSTEMTMHCGYERAGWKGLFVAGFCFIFPAVIITAILAWLYQQYGELPDVKPFIYGIKPAVIAIILMAAYRLGKKAFKNTTLIALCIFALTACLFGINEVIVLFCCSFIGLFLYFIRKRTTTINTFVPFLFLKILNPATIGSLKIFVTFLKIGAILYGSGYVLFAFLDSELVANGWLTRQQLIDAVAVGQFTPGPVLSTSTFIGWQINGIYGALAATLGIFLPSFLFVLLLNPVIPKMRKSKIMRSILDAVNAAAVALIVAVCIEMGIEILIDFRTILIAIVSLIVVFVLKKLNSAFIVLGGALLGYVLTFV